MMKEQIIKKLISIINALNNTSVSGKQNLTNVMGSISVLEDILSLIGQDEVEIISNAKLDASEKT